MKPILTKRHAREYYWRRPEFQSIVTRVGSPDNLAKLKTKLEGELASDVRVRILKRLSFGAKCSLGISILGVAFKILVFPWIFVVPIATLLVLLAVNQWLKKLREAHLEKYKESLQKAEDRDILLINRIEEEWNNYCVSFPGYPPDWKYRRILVLARDGQACTKCAWPNGVKRKVRELHIHHIKRLSCGGNNDLSNLVLLCDICHKMEDGAGHARINPRSRKQKRVAAP